MRRDEDTHARRSFVLRVIQPGLAGLMDGSVSTLAPVFAAALATQNTWEAFVVGLAASIGAGISMAFAEALSDNGSLTGRGAPIVRGAITGMMTTLGGIGHTLPFLIPSFWTAMVVAVVVVVIELAVISWVRWKAAVRRARDALAALCADDHGGGAWPRVSLGAQRYELQPVPRARL